VFDTINAVIKIKDIPQMNDPVLPIAKAHFEFFFDLLIEQKFLINDINIKDGTTLLQKDNGYVIVYFKDLDNFPNWKIEYNRSILWFYQPRNWKSRDDMHAFKSFLSCLDETIKRTDELDMAVFALYIFWLRHCKNYKFYSKILMIDNEEEIKKKFAIEFDNVKTKYNEEINTLKNCSETQKGNDVNIHRLIMKNDEILNDLLLNDYKKFILAIRERKEVLDLLLVRKDFLSYIKQTHQYYKELYNHQTTDGKDKFLDYYQNSNNVIITLQTYLNTNETFEKIGAMLQRIQRQDLP
jgi:hypothetical protein